MEVKPALRGSLLADPEALPLVPGASVMIWGRTLVVAPHHDDESLGCGGAIALLRQHGCPVHALMVSDGMRSHPHLAAYPAARPRAVRRAWPRGAVAQTDQLIAQAGGHVAPVQQVLENIPAAVHAAIERQDGEALQSALGALPQEHVEAVVAQLVEAGILRTAPQSPSLDAILKHFEPLLQGIAAMAQGDATQRAAIEEQLPQLEQRCWRLAAGGCHAAHLGWRTRRGAHGRY